MSSLYSRFSQLDCTEGEVTEIKETSNKTWKTTDKEKVTTKTMKFSLFPTDDELEKIQDMDNQQRWVWNMCSHIFHEKNPDHEIFKTQLAHKYDSETYRHYPSCFTEFTSSSERFHMSRRKRYPLKTMRHPGHEHLLEVGRYRLGMDSITCVICYEAIRDIAADYALSCHDCYLHDQWHYDVCVTCSELPGDKWPSFYECSRTGGSFMW